MLPEKSSLLSIITRGKSKHASASGWAHEDLYYMQATHKARGLPGSVVNWVISNTSHNLYGLLVGVQNVNMIPA